MKYLNASAAGDKCLPEAYTTCQRRISGMPSTAGAAMRPFFHSSSIVCSDSRLTPMPAMTACLIASLLGISITKVGWMRCRSRYSWSTIRVPESASRTTNGSSASAAAGTASARAKRWLGEVTSTCGCIANGSARQGTSFGARPITHRSTSAARSMAPSSSRTPKRSRTSTAGCSAWNFASSCGRKYMAALTMPIVRRPDSRRLSRAIASWASFKVASSLRA
mmetsp:Transcript_38692/g.90456  ORF Transcript_38692/g.90456 Transcript_38692/m.90456 type:complete len:222 (-) Transcript_38692:177-842(-)